MRALHGNPTARLGSRHSYHSPALGELLYLSRADVERLLDLDMMLDALARSLVVFSSGVTSVPPRAGARVGERGILGAMPGWVPGIALEVKLGVRLPGQPRPAEFRHTRV